VQISETHYTVPVPCTWYEDGSHTRRVDHNTTRLLTTRQT